MKQNNKKDEQAEIKQEEPKIEKTEENVQEPKDTLGDFMEICESIIISIFVVLLFFTFILYAMPLNLSSIFFNFPQIFFYH